MKSWVSSWCDDLIQDVRYGARNLMRNKVFGLTALSMLALGVAANTAIFSVVNGVILRPCPFYGEDRLVQLYGTPAVRGDAVNWADVEEFRRAGHSIEAAAGFSTGARYLQRPVAAERIMTVDVERGFFSTLGVQPTEGRSFAADDPSDTAIASESFCRRAFSGGTCELGSAINVDGVPRVIVGVMPDWFRFPYLAESRLQDEESTYTATFGSCGSRIPDRRAADLAVRSLRGLTRM
jgi:hypothetical protein